MEIDFRVREFIDIDINGIEVIYSYYNANDGTTFRQIDEKHALPISCGGDFHGSVKPHIRLSDGIAKTIYHTVF